MTAMAAMAAPATSRTNHQFGSGCFCAFSTVALASSLTNSFVSPGNGNVIIPATIADAKVPAANTVFLICPNFPPTPLTTTCSGFSFSGLP